MTGGLLVDCLVTNCWALTTTDRTLYGQAIQAENADSVIERCVIRDCGLSRNSLTTYSVVSLGGGAQMRNSVVAHNRSRGEGGVRLTGASVMENCTVVDNSVATAGHAGGVSVEGETASVVNTIVWNNTNTVDQVRRETTGAADRFDTCRTEDPLFKRRGDKWQLRTKSPCLNHSGLISSMALTLQVRGFSDLQRSYRTFPLELWLPDTKMTASCSRANVDSSP